MKLPSIWSLSFIVAILLAGIASGESGESRTPVVQASETSEAAEQAPVKRVKMYARSWKWTPDEIRVKLGTRVIIDFVSEDASHGFQIKAYKIKVSLPQDKRAQIEFVADKVGTFPWRCSRPCGNGCPKMNGKLIVME
ncbi:MAG: cupredoxin domain-containing protein [Acidobacteriota bacterium]